MCLVNLSALSVQRPAADVPDEMRAPDVQDVLLQEEVGCGEDRTSQQTPNHVNPQSHGITPPLGPRILTLMLITTHLSLHCRTSIATAKVHGHNKINSLHFKLED